jgi:hypothetical protein
VLAALGNRSSGEAACPAGIDVCEQCGRLKYREDMVEGLENAPAAFLGLLQGKNFGKLLVKVA